MAIKGVVFDVSNTLLDGGGNPHPGIADLVTFCSNKGLRIGAVSNNIQDVRQLNQTGLRIDSTYCPTEKNEGVVKPSPTVLDIICAQLGLSRSEIIYVGDKERTDAYMAANARVLFFRAIWGANDGNYGIPSTSPLFIQYFLDTFLLKTNLWHWKLRDRDGFGREVRVMATMHGFPPANVDATVRRACLGIFKYRNPLYKGYIPFFLNHLLASIYIEGLASVADYWVPYPGSKPGSGNPVFLPQYTLASKLFHGNYTEDLILRHSQSIDSGKARLLKQPLSFSNQVDTTVLARDYATRLQGKIVLVMDDFVTEGYSIECARNMLFDAGASSVVGVCIGRYPRPFQIYSSKDGVRTSPFDANSNNGPLFERDKTVDGEFVDNSQEITESFAKFNRYRNQLFR